MLDEMPQPNPPPTLSWSELPPELILTISTLLTSISDSIRFRSVCSSWRHSSSSSSPGRHFPRLAFSNPSAHCTFLSLVTSNSLSLPVGGSHQLLGSSYGLLILRSPATSSLSLLNPLTGAHTPLPSLKTFPNSPFFIKKPVLASVPTSAVLALLGWSNNLALYRPASNNSSWILIKGGCTYHDALYHNGRFHVVDGFRRVSTLDYDDGQLTEVARVVMTRAPPFIGREEKCYLVEMDGDLLLVVRKYVNKATTGFEVFKLMMETGGSSIELKGLGNWVLFLGLNRAISMMAGSEDGGVFRGNSVYFLDDGLNSMGDVAGTFRDAGVFDVGDGSIEPLRDFVADFESIQGRQPVVWFTPSSC